jgi:hypothetical protein
MMMMMMMMSVREGGECECGLRIENNVKEAFCGEF